MYELSTATVEWHMRKETNMTVITGRAFWASVQAPNTTYDADGVWTIDVSLDQANKKRVEEDGLRTKNKGDDRGDFVTIKRKVMKKNGEKNDAPDVVDSMKKPMPNVLIGNGSVVNVKYRTYDWTYQGRAGISADLQTVQVVDLVEYSGGKGGDDLPVIEGGYKHGTDITDDVPF